MTRFINCEVCQTEGRIYTANGNDPDWTDHGVCPECKGERVVEIATQSITLEDLQNCPCGGWDCTGAPEGPMYGCPYIESVCNHGKLQDGQICLACGCMGNGES